jgi:uncharacterized protein YutE (UPF0331/DUF86 family)
MTSGISMKPISKRSNPVDKERILVKIDRLDVYLSELQDIMPENYEAYQKIEKKRACERLLQVSIESVLDICAQIVIELRLGLPSEEDDIFEKLEQAKIITSETEETLKRMKGFRNILVHEYGRIDDRLVYNLLTNNIDDFKAIRKEIIAAVKRL